MKTITGTIETTKLFNQYKCVLHCSTGYYIAYAQSAIKSQNKCLKKFSVHTKKKFQLKLNFRNIVSSFKYHKENKLLARKENAHHWARHSKQVWNSRTKLIRTNGKNYIRAEIMTRIEEKQPHNIQLCGYSYKNTGIAKPMYHDNGISKWNDYIDSIEWEEKKVKQD